MGLTRRTAAFASIAEEVERLLQGRAVDVTAAQVDAVLNHKVATVASLMRVSARTALGYAPEDTPVIVADLIAEAMAAPAPAGVREGTIRAG